jgi:hypothetical protein
LWYKSFVGILWLGLFEPSLGLLAKDLCFFSGYPRNKHASQFLWMGFPGVGFWIEGFWLQRKRWFCVECDGEDERARERRKEMNKKNKGKKEKKE